jgi:hypothetical protein
LRGSLLWTGLVSLLIGGCGPAEGVEVEPLPPLERPSPEERAGLTAVEGVWRFAGWEVTDEAMADAWGEPGSPGDLVISTQRIDSIGGYLARGEQRLPIVGELRRDGVVSLLASVEEGVYRFAAGRVRGDTLRIELSNLQGGEISPTSVAWLYVRGRVGQRVLVHRDGRLLRDTVLARDTAAPAPGPAQPPAAAPAPAETPDPRPAPADTPPAPTQPQPAPPPRAEPPRAEPPPPEPQAEPRPQPQPAEPPPRDATGSGGPPDRPTTGTAG